MLLCRFQWLGLEPAHLETSTLRSYRNLAFDCRFLYPFDDICLLPSGTCLCMEPGIREFCCEGIPIKVRCGCSACTLLPADGMELHAGLARSSRSVYALGIQNAGGWRGALHSRPSAVGSQQDRISQCCMAHVCVGRKHLHAGNILCGSRTAEPLAGRFSWNLPCKCVCLVSFHEIR